MTTQSFQQKYKPYFIDDFYLPHSVKDIIRCLFEMDDVNILFFGGSQSGKTSLLYAVIRDYYGLQRNDPFPDDNIMFINNLKEQGVKYYREDMKAFCQCGSHITGKKKILVVDDMDNITVQGQQIFCNYLDKYRRNICFISVTSNLQKIIENIQSRTHIIHVTAPNNNELRQFLEHIVDKEQIQITEQAKDYIVQISNYSIRLVLTNIEKLYIFTQLEKTIDVELCTMLCTNISYEQLEQYLQMVKRGNRIQAFEIVNDIYEQGYSVIDIMDALFVYLKFTSTLEEKDKYECTKLICKYIHIFHTIHENGIELAFFTNNLCSMYEKQP